MRVKFPRTYHLPFSLGATSDDKRMRDTCTLVGREVVITEKLDGECTTLYRDGFHARSLDSSHDSTQAWVAKFQGGIAHLLAENERICGENLYAKHSIHYTQLPSYFMGYSVWDASNTALAYDDTLERFEALGIVPVPELYRGTYTDKLAQELAQQLDLEQQEGFVVRVTDPISYDQYGELVGKFVRAGHVQTDKHWKRTQLIKNGLKRDA